MNYQLTEEMPEYFDEFEKMLFHLPLIGTAVKKFITMKHWTTYIRVHTY